VVTRETEPDTPQASATERRHSVKRLALVGGAALVAILAVLGVYLVAFRSLPTTVSWATSASAIAQGRDLTVSGQITPSESGRHVVLQSASSARGPWQPVTQVAITDSRGRFAISFKPKHSGPIVIRVVVDPTGRHLEAASQAKPVHVLTLSGISLKGVGTTTNRTPTNFAVSVDPSGAGRTVRIEQSSDKLQWVPVGPPVRTKADGTAVVRVSSLTIGMWSYRATVAQDDKFTAAVSPLVGAKVEDFKVVAARAAAVARAKEAARIQAEANAAAEAQRKAVAEQKPSANCAAAAMAAGKFDPSCPDYQGYLDCGTACGRAPTSGELQQQNAKKP
jgi:hypothetical protein